MDRSIVDRIREIVFTENEFGSYNDDILEFCFPNENVIVIRDSNGNPQTFRRLKTTSRFILEDVYNLVEYV